MNELPESLLQPMVDALDQFVAQLATGSRPSDSRRLFHGRGHCFEGLAFVTADWFDPLLLITLYQAPPPNWLQAFAQRLQAHPVFAVAGAVMIQHRYQADAPAQWLKPLAGADVVARRGALQFLLSPGDHQNIGYFLDMEPGRTWLESLCAGKRVLNLFAYTCAFSVVAVAAGASQVVNVDMSRSALARGRDNHRINNLPLIGVKFLAENILKSWSRIRRPGPYDIVILDPPSFQRGSFVAEKDYGKLVRRLPELLPSGGDVLACLNAPELDSGFLEAVFRRECPAASYLGRIAPHPDFHDREPERALKLLHFRCPPAAEV